MVKMVKGCSASRVALAMKGRELTEQTAFPLQCTDHVWFVGALHGSCHCYWLGTTPAGVERRAILYHCCPESGTVPEIGEEEQDCDCQGWEASSYSLKKEKELCMSHCST